MSNAIAFILEGAASGPPNVQKVTSTPEAFGGLPGTI